MRDPRTVSDTGRRKRWYAIGGGALVAVLLAGLAVWWFIFRGDAPAAVDLDRAVSQLEEDLLGGGEATAVDISGDWTVDNTIGTFDYETASGSFAGFRVDEELTIGHTTAVGRTGDVTGTISIDGTTLTATEVEIDLTTITTDRSRRDSRVQSALETERFPTAMFSLTTPVQLPAAAVEREAFTVEAVGDLTVHGVTKPATFAIDAQLVDDIVVVVGSTEIDFDDYDVTAPSAPVVLSVEDHGIVEFQLLFTR